MVTQVVVAAPAANSATAEVVVVEATVVKVMAEVVAGVAARYHQEGPWQAPSSFATQGGEGDGGGGGRGVKSLMATQCEHATCT